MQGYKILCLGYTQGTLEQKDKKKEGAAMKKKSGFLYRLGILTGLLILLGQPAMRVDMYIAIGIPCSSASYDIHPIDI